MYIKALVLLTLLSTFLCASEYHVKIGTTTSKKQMTQIDALVKKMGHSTKILKQEQSYTLYAGPFESLNETKQSYLTIQRVFPEAQIVRLHLDPLAKTTSTDSSEQVSTNKKTKRSSAQEEKFFVTFAVGYGKSPANYSGDDNVSKVMPKESTTSYGLEAGYNFDENFWTSAGYNLISTSDITLKNLYATANYNFYRYKDLHLYSGLILGWSTLSWDTAPLLNSEELTDSTSLFGGLQLGAEYALPFYQLSVYSSLQYLMFDHSIALNESGSIGNIEHSSLQNIQLGLKYSF